MRIAPAPQQLRARVINISSAAAAEAFADGGDSLARTAGLSVRDSWVNTLWSLHLLVGSSIKKSLMQVTVYGFPLKRFAVTLICARSHAPSSPEPPLPRALLRDYP